ncbi:MAG TPA: GNAT family N-acetyltransferase [Dehalococcoidia bacterium]
MKIIVVESPDDEKGIERFLAVATSVYKDDPIWVPESEQEFVRRFKTAGIGTEVRMWPVVALKDGSPVGRAVAILDRVAVDENGNSQGWLAFFEFMSGNESAAISILKRCEEILSKAGATSVLAPKADNLLVGLLTDGFTMPQTVLTNHNPPYYKKIFNKYGYQAKSKILTFNLNRDTVNQLETTLPGVTTREFNRKKISQELVVFHRLQSYIFAQSDSYVARSPDQDKEMVESLLPILDDELIIIAEDSKRNAIGLLICLPDIYQAFKGQDIDRARIISVGVMPGWEKRGVGTMMGTHLMKNLLRKGYRTAEASWILDTNVASHNLVKHFNATPGREFILFRKIL